MKRDRVLVVDGGLTMGAAVARAIAGEMDRRSEVDAPGSGPRQQLRLPGTGYCVAREPRPVKVKDWEKRERGRPRR